MKNLPSNRLCSIESHQYSCSEDLEAFFLCVKCKNKIMRVSSHLSFVLMSFTNEYLYFFSTQIPEETAEEVQIKVNTSSRVRYLDQPFKDMEALMVNCTHCETRIGTLFESVGPQAHEQLKEVLLIQIDSLEQDDANADLIQYLVEVGKNTLNISNIQISHTNTKLLDLLLSAKKEKPSSPESFESITVQLEKREYQRSSSENQSSEGCEEPIYKTMEEQRRQIEDQLGSSDIESIDLYSVFNNLLKENQKKKVSSTKNTDFLCDSIDESEAESQESAQQYFFGELCKVDNPKQGEFYYSQDKWYEYSKGKMVETSKFEAFAVQLIDQNFQQIKSSLNQENKAIRNYVRGKIQGTHRVINQRELFTKNNPYDTTTQRLNELINQYNKLVDDQDQSFEEDCDSSDEAQLIDDQGEFEQLWGNSDEIPGKEEREKADSLLTTISFYEERNKELRSRIKVAIAVDEQQNQRICKFTDLE